MNVDRATWLLNAELDNELAPNDRAELETLLAAQPQLQVQRLELRQLAQGLASVPDIDPPPGLAERITSEVRLVRRRRFRWTLPRWCRPVNALPFASCAAAIMLAAGAFWILQHEPLPDDVSDMVGSLLHDPKQSPLPAGERLRLNQSGVSADVALLSHAGSSLRTLEFALDSSGPVDISIDLAASGLEFAGFARDEAGVELLSGNAGRVTLRSQGEHRFTLSLRAPSADERPEANIGLSISDGPEQIFQGTIEAP
ncbi:anti-sigma factor family protein [Haliea sp. E17]|uniref:anti-sigma factor family protein n=1 Tax=Haliea sp. E17 TaxID=3401576 RepID=UPI003AAF918C